MKFLLFILFFSCLSLYSTDKKIHLSLELGIGLNKPQMIKPDPLSSPLYADFDADKKTKFVSNIGFLVGISVEKQIKSRNIYLLSGLYFENTNFKSTTTYNINHPNYEVKAQAVRYQYNNFVLPLQVKISFGNCKTFFIKSGCTIALQYSKIYSYGLEEKSTWGNTHRFKSTEMYLTTLNSIGHEFKHSKKSFIFTELRHSFSINKIIRSSGFYNGRLSSFYFVIGYRF